jgi:hypothetical protein
MTGTMKKSINYARLQTESPDVAANLFGEEGKLGELFSHCAEEKEGTR